MLAQHANITDTSSIYETEAWQMPEGSEAFLNMVLRIECEVNVYGLLALTQDIERECLRTDKEKNISRTLDVDVLLFNEEIIHSRELTIPHPRLHLRRFTLMPLCEIAGENIHPLLKQSFNQILNQCTDICAVRQYAAAL